MSNITRLAVKEGPIISNQINTSVVCDTISHDTSISRSMQSKTLERSCSKLDLEWVINVRVLLVSGHEQILV